MARIRLLAAAAVVVSAAGGCGFRTGLGVPGAFEFVSVHGPASLVQGQTQAFDVTLLNRSSAPARPPQLGVDAFTSTSSLPGALSIAFDPASVAAVAPGATITIHPHLTVAAGATPQAISWDVKMLDGGDVSDVLGLSILRMATLVIEDATIVGNTCVGVSTANVSAGATELKGMLRNQGDSPAVLGAEAGPEIEVGANDVTTDFQVTVTGTASTLAGVTIAPHSAVAFDWLLHAAASTPVADAATVRLGANATDGTTGATVADPTGSRPFAILSPVRFEWEITTAPATVSGGQTGLSLVLTATQAGTSHGTVTALAPKFFVNGTDVSGDYTSTTVTSTPFPVTNGQTGIAFSWTIDVAASPTLGSASVAPAVTGTDDGCGIPLPADNGATGNVSKAVWQVQ